MSMLMYVCIYFVFIFVTMRTKQLTILKQQLYLYLYQPCFDSIKCVSLRYMNVYVYFLNLPVVKKKNVLLRTIN